MTATPRPPGPQADADAETSARKDVHAAAREADDATTDAVLADTPAPAPASLAPGEDDAPPSVTLSHPSISSTFMTRPWRSP